MFYPKNSYLVQTFDKILSRFVTAGLIDFWASKQMDMKFLNFKAGSSGPKRLNLEHLSGTVQIWIGGCLLAFVAFIAELICVKQQKKLLRIKQYLKI